jgi:ribosomal-protein-alanine N-acetyltransferase
MTAFPERLTTERLQLRRARPDDANGVFRYASDPEVAKYMTFPLATSRDESLTFLQDAQASMDDDTSYSWILERKSEPGVMGIVSYRRLHGLEVGYCLGRDYWGNGYMPEAVRALIAWAQENEPVQRIWATCDIENEKSASVLLKVGMVEEGVLRKWAMHPNIDPDTPRDCRVFSLP